MDIFDKILDSCTAATHLQIMRRYPKVLMRDATYKISNLRMPLYSLAVVDNEGHGQPVVHALMAQCNPTLNCFLQML